MKNKSLRPNGQMGLVILAKCTRQNCELATKFLRSLNVKILSRIDGQCWIIRFDASQRKQILGAAFFVGLFEGSIQRETVAKIPAASKGIEIWNLIRSKSYRDARRKKAHGGESWGNEKRTPPAPALPFPIEQVKQALVKNSGMSQQELLRKFESARSNKPIQGKSYVEYYQKLKKKYKNPELAEQVARTAFYLDDSIWQAILAEADESVVTTFHHVGVCRRMIGEISVGIVVVESSQRGGPVFPATERNTLESQVADGLQWLADMAPQSANLSWSIDIQRVTINVDDQPNPPNFHNDEYWSRAGIGSVTFNGQSFSADDAGIEDYRNAMIAAHGSTDGAVIFLSPYTTGHHAYASASSSKIVITNHNNYGNWGIHDMYMTTAHEMCHIFGAQDEYSGSVGTPCSDCSVTSGCFHIPNGNCNVCADPMRNCIMSGHMPEICAYTRGQIGWADLVVEVETADNEWWTGTDDDVEIDFGRITFNLDDANFNDFESSQTNAFAFEMTGLTDQDIQRVLLRKSPDGFAGGWKCSNVRVFVAGTEACDQQVNHWFQNGQLFKLVQDGPTVDADLVNSIEVEVTTADEFGAGTDSGITLQMGGESWDLDTAGNDFESGNTDVFQLDPRTGLLVSAINNVRIIKDPNGFGDIFGIGNWKLAGLKVTVNGVEIYNNQSIDQWLADNNLEFLDNV